MTVALRCGVWLAVVVPAIAAAKSCTISKQFRVRQKQVFAGVIQDQNGAGLPGIEMELLHANKIVQHQQTGREGKYQFGEIAPGTYQIHVRSVGDTFCAPEVKCGTQGCTTELRLALNPKLKPVIVR